ncbi:MAG: hypothetical protein L6R42_002670 [Xanthoria sp. 1 TBL-2021]|nr:MAG: hypothetical protein L6R42_002670 [Xanthoria sp. 1 TBL-2021]
MPSNTQSQGATLETPLTPSRKRSQRTKKPSSRQEFAEQQAQNNKQTRRKEKEDNQLLKAELGDAAPSSKRAREIRARHVHRIAERTETARRIRQEVEHKKSLWDAEVAKWGEAEAQRRRRLELDIRKGGGTC